MPIKRLLATFGAILAIVVACAGCGSSGTPSVVTTANPSTVTATTTVVKTVRSTALQTVTTTVTAGGGSGGTTPAGFPPADFFDYGNGVYGAFETNHDAFDCAASDNRCWGVKVAATAGCPNGVALKLTIYPEGQDTAAATVEQSSGEALAPGEIKTIVVGSSKLPDDGRYEAEITDAHCA